MRLYTSLLSLILFLISMGCSISGTVGDIDLSESELLTDSEDNDTLTDSVYRELLEGTEYDLVSLDKSLIEMVSIDSDNDGVVDGFDLDGNSDTLEIVLSESISGAYSIDINGDGISDCYFSIRDDNTLSLYSNAEFYGTEWTVSMDDDNQIEGLDTDDDGEIDVFNIRLKEQAYSLPSWIDSADSNSSFTGADSDDDNIVDALEKSVSPSLSFQILDEVADGIYSIDINNDDSTDFYLLIDSLGNVTSSTASDGTGENTRLVFEDGIFKGMDTDGDKLADVKVSEGNITIVLPENRKISLSMTSGTAYVKGNTISCTATLDGASGWFWYVDGAEESSPDGNTIAIDTADLSYGVHNLAVIAVTDSGSYSKQISFNVTN